MGTVQEQSVAWPKFLATHNSLAVKSTALGEPAVRSPHMVQLRIANVDVVR